MDKFDIRVTLEAGVESCRWIHVFQVFVRNLFLERDSSQAVLYRASIHDCHDLFQHLLVLGVNLAHLVIASVDSTGRQVVELFGLPFVNVALQIDQFVD